MCPENDLLPDFVSQGTPYFMSIEIQTDYYVFAPADLEDDLKPPPFLHNYMHDVEGLWWIAMWSFFFTIPISRIKEVKLNQKLPQEISAQKIFPLSVTGSSHRSQVFQRRSAFDKRVGNIPSEFALVVPLMADAASLIRKRYTNNQLATTIEQINTPEPYATVYDPLAQLFREAALLAPKDVRQMSSIRAVLEEQSEETTEDEDVSPLTPVKADVSEMHSSQVKSSTKPVETRVRRHSLA